MSTRPDMIGPRRLTPAGYRGRSVSTMSGDRRPLMDVVGPVTTRGTINGVVPSCHEALLPPIPQPALIIRDDLLGKSKYYQEELSKAVRAHVDAMIKASIGDTSSERLVGPTPKVPRPSSEHRLFDTTKTDTPTGGSAKTVVPTGESVRTAKQSEPQPPVDVSTPQHDHARLEAKKLYLTEKLASHDKAGHPATHPEVAHRTKVLGQVNRGLQNLESQGIKSTPQHHMDWIHHYGMAQFHDPAGVGKMHPDQVSVSLGAHLRSIAEPHRSGETHEGKPGDVTQPRSKILSDKPQSGVKFGGTASVKRSEPFDTKVLPLSGAASKKAKQLSTEPAVKSLYLISDMIKGQKSKEWISNKISILRHEGYPQEQAIAIAHSMAGRSKKKVNKSISLFIAQ